MKIPKCYTEEMNTYLFELRDSGVTNMWGAGSYLEDEFGLTSGEAKDVLLYWMYSFKGK